jgi:chromosome segregation ATPase
MFEETANESTQDDTQEQSSGSTGNVDWETRFKGLQATLDREKKAHRETQLKLQSTVGAMTTEQQGLRDQLAQLTNERDTFKTQVTDLLGQKTTAETAAATAAKQLTRFQKIAKASPALIEDLEQGLMRVDLDPETPEFDDYLAKYAGKLGQVTTAAKKEALTGASSTGGSAKPPAASPQELIRQANQALMSGDREKYEQLYSEAVKISASK